MFFVQTIFVPNIFTGKYSNLVSPVGGGGELTGGRETL